MSASHFQSASFKQPGRVRRGEMCRQMITGVGITSGIFSFLSPCEGSSPSCPFPMQPFPKSDMVLTARLQGSRGKTLSRAKSHKQLIHMWLNIMGYLKITEASGHILYGNPFD